MKLSQHASLSIFNALKENWTHTTHFAHDNCHLYFYGCFLWSPYQNMQPPSVGVKHMGHSIYVNI